MDNEKFKQSKQKERIQTFFTAAELLRNKVDGSKDVSMQELMFKNAHPDKAITEDAVEEHFNEVVLGDMGIDPSHDTANLLLTLPENGPKWLVPEIVRSAIRLGMKRSPIYPNIINGEQPVNALKVQMPMINQSDAAPRYVNEAETIQFGSISYSSKEFKLRKMGRGISISDEVSKYTSINVMRIFFEDFGTRLGYALDSMAIDTLLNGEQLNGSASAPVIGVDTVGTFTIRDLMKVWIKGSRIGKNFNTMVGNEDTALAILDLPEFKRSDRVAAPERNLNLRTPIPTTSNFFVHGSIPTSQVIILDPRAAIIKYNAAPLMIESERMVSNQTVASYATLTTGFSTIFRDARVVVDNQESIVDAPFPDYFNVDALAMETVKYKYTDLAFSL